MSHAFELVELAFSQLCMYVDQTDSEFEVVSFIAALHCIHLCIRKPR